MGRDSFGTVAKKASKDGMDLAFQLRQGLRDSGKRIRVNVPQWGKQFDELMQKKDVGVEEVSSAIAFLTENDEDQYVPVCTTPGAIERKWHKIQMAIARYRKKSFPNFHRTEVGDRIVRYILANCHLPANADANQAEGYVYDCLQWIQNYRKNVRDRIQLYNEILQTIGSADLTNKDKRHRYRIMWKRNLLRHMDSKIPDPESFVREWVESVCAYCSSLTNYTGDGFLPFSVSYENGRLQHYLTTQIRQYNPACQLDHFKKALYGNPED